MAMGTARIHFTAADLGRTHVVAEPDPFWELVLSLHVLQGENPRRSFPEWRQSLPRREHWAPIGALARSMLAPLSPPGPYFPDFLTPPESSGGFDTGLEAILRTPQRRVRHELGRVVPLRGSAGWVAQVANGSAATWENLGRAIRTYFDHALAPYWPTIRATARAEFLLRSRIQADRGITGLLASMAPTLRWNPPILEVPGPSDRDLELEGRGLTIIPSYFNWKHAMLIYDPELPPVVVYPAARLGALVLDDATPESALADLIGSRRAAALRAIAGGCTTTELASTIGVSLSSASEHATVLRRAGQITTKRHGHSVWHALTPLGTALLATEDPAPAPQLSRPA
jgi:DNA-binding transcriptional ArsR family regulator